MTRLWFLTLKAIDNCLKANSAFRAPPIEINKEK